MLFGSHPSATERDRGAEQQPARHRQVSGGRKLGLAPLLPLSLFPEYILYDGGFCSPELGFRLLMGPWCEKPRNRPGITNATMTNR